MTETPVENESARFLPLHATIAALWGKLSSPEKLNLI